MKIRARPYSDQTDPARLRHLLMAGRQANIPASYMHPGYLDWATHCPPDERANRRNLRLWERVDENRPAMAAWAIFMPNPGSFDLFVHPTLYGAPAHELVMDEFVAWAEVRARQAGLKHLWPFWALEHDEVLKRLMRARGFVVVQAEPAPPLFERALDELPAVQLPEGFTVQAVRNLDDGRLHAQATHSAFRPDDDWDSYWAEYAQFIGCAVYDGERDLLVRSPDGRGASASTIWFDPLNAVGLDPHNTAARALYTSMGFGPRLFLRSLGKSCD